MREKPSHRLIHTKILLLPNDDCLHSYTALLQTPDETRYNSLMNHCCILTITIRIIVLLLSYVVLWGKSLVDPYVKIIVLLLSYAVLSCRNLVMLTHMNVVHVGLTNEFRIIYCGLLETVVRKEILFRYEARSYRSWIWLRTPKRTPKQNPLSFSVGL